MELANKVASEEDILMGHLQALKDFMTPGAASKPFLVLQKAFERGAVSSQRMLDVIADPFLKLAAYANQIPAEHNDKTGSRDLAISLCGFWFKAMMRAVDVDVWNSAKLAELRKAFFTGGVPQVRLAVGGLGL